MMATLAQSVWQLLSPMNEMHQPGFVKTGAWVAVRVGVGVGGGKCLVRAWVCLLRA